MQIVLHRAFRTGRSHLVKWHLRSDGPGSLRCNRFLLMLPVSCSGTDALAMPSFNVSPNDWLLLSHANERGWGVTRWEVVANFPVSVSRQQQRVCKIRNKTKQNKNQ